MNNLPSSVHDFDWYFGTWHVNNRKLKERLVGSNDWLEFTATDNVKPILGGLGNINELDFDDGTENPLKGFTLRIFDPNTELWSLYWVDNKGAELQTPLVGKFENGIAKMYADDIFKGQPIQVCFTWSNMSPTYGRWEQAFSQDNGANWEVNWIMEFTRMNE